MGTLNVFEETLLHDPDVRFGFDNYEVLKQIGALVRDMRVQSAMSQTALGEASGFPQAEISRLESGSMERGPSLLTLVRLAHAAGKRLVIGIEDEEGENKELISNKLNSANWMIQAIEQRRQTMLKVMNYIVERQREFFEKGVQFLKPLTLREVAEVISMHESTVSRVTHEKYVQTPRGVLPLKYFFSSGLATADGEDVSARGIKAQLEKLVEDEDPKHPLTDQAIVNILKETGVQIARRTVAKYRDQLGVLSARMRKRV